MPDKYIEIKITSNGDDGVKPGSSLKSALGDIPKGVIGAEYDGKLYGLEDSVHSGGEYRLLTVASDGVMKLFWHSSAHLLAQAVRRLYPHVKLGIGPAIANGFYYDFDFGEQISSDDLERIEAEMAKCVEEDYPIQRSEISSDDALTHFDSDGQDFKLELIEEIDEQITTYSQGEFTDLCRGPHVPSTGMLKNFKLLSVTGAYWRGDERNPMLQRIYGTSFPTAKQLRTHLKQIEEAKKRDHRLLGKQLNLFSFHPEAPGKPFWHDNGVVLFKLIEGYLSDLLRRRGYSEVKTPLIMTRDLWERSGHWDHYHDNMYFITLDDREFAVKPMNCPGAVLMYQERQWSYRDFPQRWAELGIVHRYEKSGTMHGLFRVRHITQDDAHIFCTQEQLVDEVVRMVKLVFEIYSHFGMSEINVEMSTRPKDRIGKEELWDKAEGALEQALEREGIKYEVNKGEGAFYGPKIDFHVVDSLGRNWQCSTIQVDFNFPERFDLEYIGSDNQAHRPVMLHRAILGSMERFMGILIEHYGGKFPLWLSPVQVSVLPITENQNEYAQQIVDRLLDKGIRCIIDSRSEKVGKKIREAEMQKTPYMLIIGANEVESNELSVRMHGRKDLGTMNVEQFLAHVSEELKST